eukprot:TRINITY_DN9893_c0_g1_i2.p1 TRINITY_DN9893_c0_g1~~TRINITY_DN9893_c0_g1_i2.p1  ORF type:complete len:403 (-),score=119.12 TRINITY_DN9893_c0_g1_i2:225-1322(-)
MEPVSDVAWEHASETESKISPAPHARYHRFQPKVPASSAHKRAKHSSAVVGRGTHSMTASPSSASAEMRSAPMATCAADRYENALNLAEHHKRPPAPSLSRFSAPQPATDTSGGSSKRLLVKRKRGDEPLEGFLLQQRAKRPRKASLLSAIDNLTLSDEAAQDGKVVPGKKRKLYRLAEVGDGEVADTERPEQSNAKRRRTHEYNEKEQNTPAEQHDGDAVPERYRALMQELGLTDQRRPQLFGAAAGSGAEADGEGFVMDVYEEVPEEELDEAECSKYRTLFVEQFPDQYLLAEEYDSDVDSEDLDGQECDYPEEEEQLFGTSDEDDGSQGSDGVDVAYHSDYREIETDEDEDDEGSGSSRAWW